MGGVLEARLLVFLAIFAGIAVGQHATTYSNPTVPTGKPIPGKYTGPLRPQIHFSPPIDFMNDPNGLFLDANGTWHLYYQYNPTGTGGGNQHWGHATSPDLFHWLNQQIALFPPQQTTYVFSGSAVVDTNNTSGFFPGQNNGVVTIFTLAHYNSDGSQGPETQNIAYSLDNGFTYQYFDGNPVIDSTLTDFRDPKVIRYNDHWAMVVSFVNQATIGIYTSRDLKKWTPTSNFSLPGVSGVTYECPNILKLPIRDSVGGNVVSNDGYLMAVGTTSGNPSGSGSAIMYVAGSFDGMRFTPFNGAKSRFVDFGKDNYAGQFYSGIPDGHDVVSFGWASNLQYAGGLPTADSEGWRSTMTLPRQNYLVNTPNDGWIMVSELVDLAPVLDQKLKDLSWNGDGSNGATVLDLDFSGVDSNAIYVDINISGLDMSAKKSPASLSMTLLAPGTGETLVSGFNFGTAGDSTFSVDRSNLRGWPNNDDFNKAKLQAKDAIAGSQKRWQAVFDRTSYEAYIDSGVHAGSILAYPTQPLTKLTLKATSVQPGTKVSIQVWGIKSAWKEFEDSLGIVHGNITTQQTAPAPTDQPSQGINNSIKSNSASRIISLPWSFLWK
jgi:beta-fructofuranosidase